MYSILYIRLKDNSVNVHECSPIWVRYIVNTLIIVFIDDMIGHASINSTWE